MSDFTISRKRRRRAIDPCLGFYVSSSVHARREEATETQFTVQTWQRQLAEPLQTPAGPHLERNAGNVITPSLDTLFQRTVLPREYPRTTPSDGRLVTGASDGQTSRIVDTPPISVEEFLRRSAAPTKATRALRMARYVSKHKRRYRALTTFAPDDDNNKLTTDVCGPESSREETPFIDKNMLYSSVQFLGNSQSALSIPSTVDDNSSDVDNLDSDLPMDADSSPRRGFVATAYRRKSARLTKKQQKVSATRTLNDRLFDALVLTHGSPDESLIHPDPYDSGNPHRNALHFEPGIDAEQQKRRGARRNFVNPRKSLAIRSATLTFSKKRDDNGTSMESVLNRWPANTILNQSMAQRQIEQSHNNEMQRARRNHKYKNSICSMELKSGNRIPLTFTDSVCAETSYAKMFSSTAIGTFKPKSKPENELSALGIIDLIPNETGEVYSRRPPRKDQKSSIESSVIAQLVDERATLSLAPDPTTPQNDIDDTRGPVTNNYRLFTSFNPTLRNVAASISSESASSGTGPQDVKPPQATKNTLQRGVEDDNLYNCARQYRLHSKKSPTQFVAFMTSLEGQTIQSHVSDDSFVDSHPKLRRLPVTRHKPLQSAGAHVRSSAPSTDLSPISTFSLASIEGHDEFILDEIENEYPRMRSSPSSP
ncbi:hypothetical protein CVT24_000759 [Panaeolus cyanescens]|uniref:Uncharacterized protein n=1 Tax=Panaeolus cyanescens TaxID=181874 RepID=A0A409YCR5_9AGAR|nr:hypothetical protein CVT24_000759 [Panaeolus cyanescens]